MSHPSPDSPHSPSSPRVFDLATAALAPGAALLEASAGTGKTWTIAGLYVRLVGEKGLTPRQILAVTFTEAATAELRDRLRRRLAEVRAALRSDAPSADGAVTALRRAIVDGLDATTVDRRLATALGSFDEAAIHTLHGFCQRLLREQAFACGTPFVLEVEADGDGLRQTAAEDVWRQFLARRGSPTARLALAKKWSPATPSHLHATVARTGPETLVRTSAGGRSLEEAEADLAAMLPLTLAAWTERRAEVMALLTGHPGVSKSQSKGLPPERLAEYAAALDDANADPWAPEVLEAMRGLATEQFQGPYVLKKHAPPEHPFFEVASRLAAAHTRWVGAAQEHLLAAIGERLDRLADERGVATFDHLIGRVYDALRGPGAGALVALLRERYPAALIDEFQDTDTRQWSIFRRLFRHGGGYLYLIGDPKQAIYRFRGADLFAYLDARDELAAEDPDRIHTLGSNYRSRPELVAAVNALFEAPSVPDFLGGGVGFTPVAAAAQGLPELYFGPTRQPALRHLRLVGPEEMTSGVYRKQLATLAAAYADHLLRNGRLVGPDGEREVLPSDLAMLVRKGSEAHALEAALREFGLASLRQTDESVLASEEADQLFVLLTALRAPGDEGAWRAALATRLLGASAADLEALREDDAPWAQELARAAHWRALWEEHSFMRAFRTFLDEASVRTRWLAHPGGERALTNLLHLGELLHESARRQHLGPDALLRHFRRQRQAAHDGAAPEEHLLRLETDAGAIRLVTVHRAKGLEYPIVLAPFHNAPLRTSRGFWTWHDAGRRAVLDLTGTPSEDDMAAARREEREDEARLLYVSLTRAQLHLALFDGPAKIHGHDFSPLATLLGERADTVTPCTEPADLLAMGEASPPRPRAQAEAADQVDVVPARRARDLPPDPLYESFSSLAEAASLEHDPADRDAVPNVVAPLLAEVDAAPSIHNLLAGARTGDALHSVLEQALAPAADPALSLRDLTERAFVRHLLPDTHLGVTLDALAATLSHPYPCPEGPALRLDRLPPAARRPEIAFLVPLRRHVSAAAVADVLRGAPGLPADLPQRLGQVARPLADGFLTGFLDLVVRGDDGRYHLFDWKSNKLGPDASAYAPERMERAMEEHLYGLQYHLYLVALSRHLRRRMPEFSAARHLGEVRYVFLRGLDPENAAAGVFTARPDPALLAALEDVLCPPLEDIT